MKHGWQRYVALLFVAVAVWGMRATPALGDAPLTPQAALERLFSAPQIQSEWFAPSFLVQVSAAEVQTIVRQFATQLGDLKSVVPEGGNNYRLIFARGTDEASIALDADGRIVGLFFRAPAFAATNFDEALKAFQALPGQVSVLVITNGVERGSIHPDDPLAVGSTFKLAVINAVKKAVDDGRASWETVLRLQAARKSLPSGILQDWPDGAPLTLYSVAALAISQSDNTAADTLIEFVGRSNVEAWSRYNRPFLTTREAFVLKDPRNADLLGRYRAGTEAQRRALLPLIDAKPLPDASIFLGGPLHTEIEWFFTTRELCTLMANVESLPFMSINPGVAKPADWRHVAYKGGSEPGVLNLTTWVVDKSGNASCVSATWNDRTSLDDTKFFGLYGALLSSLKS
jgi:beta-lactamase class A